jgi:hypothetical protein
VVVVTAVTAAAVVRAVAVVTAAAVAKAAVKAEEVVSTVLLRADLAAITTNRLMALVYCVV